MKNLLLLLLVLSNCHLSFSSWFSSELFAEIMVGNMVDAISNSDLLEADKNHKIDTVMSNIKKKCLLYEVNYDEVLKQSFFFCSEKIKYYKKMTERSEINYGPILFCLAVGITCPLLAYYFYSTRGETIRRIEQELVRSGAMHISSSIDYASCYTFLGSRWNLSLLLNSLVAAKQRQLLKDAFTLLSPGISCFFVSTAIFAFTEQKYANFYYQNYCFVKERLKWHLDNKMNP